MSGVPVWARVGAKVVCVSAFGGSTARYIPRKGDVCTISAVEPDHQYGPMLRLVEYGEERVSDSTTRRYSYPVHCFRPVITIEDDLKAHFRHHLDAPVRVSEEA